MYFPYLRGRQYELLALRELVENNRLGKRVVPIIEPVKLSPTLISTMREFVSKDQQLAIICNPVVGSFASDWNSVGKQSKEAAYKQEFLNLYQASSNIKSLILRNNSKEILDYWEKKNVKKEDFLVINSDRDYLEIFEKLFGNACPKFVLMPDESVYRRRIRKNRVLLDDKFEKQGRNADYSSNEDEFFSEDHIYYAEDGYIGFSDYSIVGNEFMEAGFAPYAVAIHVVYFAEDKTLRVRHFVSDSNEDISNPALKYYEAVSKLHNWYYLESPSALKTLGLDTFLEHYEQQSYPGLGTVKKLSLMHHLELMSNYLDGEE